MSEREYVTEADKKVSSLAAVNATKRCGGVFVNGAEPACCEVHLLPWGHARRRAMRGATHTTIEGHRIDYIDHRYECLYCGARLLSMMQFQGRECPDPNIPEPLPLPIHRTEAGYPHCSTCDGGGCLDCTDPA